MRQTRIAKHRSRTAAWKQAPLPLDGRDPDIVKAHQLARDPGSRGLADGLRFPDHGTLTSATPTVQGR